MPGSVMAVRNKKKSMIACMTNRKIMASFHHMFRRKKNYVNQTKRVLTLVQVASKITKGTLIRQNVKSRACGLGLSLSVVKDLP